MKLRSILVFLGLLTIANSSEQVNQIEYCIYEFHPQYLIFTNAVLLNSKNSLYQFIERHPEILTDTISCNPLYQLNLPDLYEREDLLEVICSPNIGRFVAEWDTMKWRGEIFDRLCIRWLPQNMTPDSFFLVQGKIKKLPHLHTHNFISPDREFELGVNAKFSTSRSKAKLQIFTFPKGTKIIETSGFTPCHRFDYRECLILLYDLPDGHRISSHVSFILPRKDVPTIEIDHFLKAVLKETKNSRVDSINYEEK